MIEEFLNTRKCILHYWGCLVKSIDVGVLHLEVFFIISKIVCNSRRTIQPYILVLEVLKVVQFLIEKFRKIDVVFMMGSAVYIF